LKQRDSNIELLRIIATAMIVMTHFSGYYLTLASVDSFWIGGTAMALTRTSMSALSLIGVNLFIFISGYFSIKPKGKSLLNLFTCLAFFYAGLYILNCFITNESVLQHHRLLRSLMAFSRENWFIQCYLFLVLLSPMLNKFVKVVSERQLLIYISVFLFCAFYFGCIHNSTYFYFNSGYSITTFMLVYLIGRYMRLYGIKRLNAISTCSLFFVYIACTLLLVVLKLYLPNAERLWSYCSPVTILSATAFFLPFTRLNFESNFVNQVGSSCLATYIVHTCPPVSSWIINIDVQLLKADNALLYLGEGYNADYQRVSYINFA